MEPPETPGRFAMVAAGCHGCSLGFTDHERALFGGLGCCIRYCT